MRGRNPFSSCIVGRVLVADPFLVGVFYGFVPAMGFLYIVLHEYHAFFEEKKVFRVFLFGMIAGVLGTLLEQFMGPALSQVLTAPRAGSQEIVTLGVFALLLGLLEAMIFAAVLNWRTFRGRRDTPFYGTAFGLGFGGANVVFLIFLITSVQAQIGVGSSEWIAAFLLSMLGLYFMGGILVHGTMGAWIGQATGSGGLPRAILRAALVRGAYIGLFYAIVRVGDALTSHMLALLGIAAGVALIGRTIHDLLDHVVPPEVLREMGIHNRRLARQIYRDPGQKP